jgi:hypothetical protein
LKKIKKSQKIKLLYGSLQKASILMLKIFINTEFDLKKQNLKIWGDSVKKLKDKSKKTLKKPKDIINSEPPNLWNNYILINDNGDDKNFEHQD